MFKKFFFHFLKLSPSGKTEFKIPLSLSLERSFSLDVNGTVYDEYSGDSVYDLKKLNVYQTEIYYDININYFKVNETNDYEVGLGVQIKINFVTSKRFDRLLKLLATSL